MSDDFICSLFIALTKNIEDVARVHLQHNLEAVKRMCRMS